MQTNYGNPMSQSLNIRSLDEPLVSYPPPILRVTDAKRVGGALNGSLILPRCDWGRAVREFAGIGIDAYVFFSYSAKLLFWRSVWERQLLYQVEFRFILR